VGAVRQRPDRDRSGGRGAARAGRITPKAGPGVTGTLGTIKRSGGGLQATYDSHPLYTYAGDSAPGQAHGNMLDLNGGYWYEVRA